jgi:hypothetical protein
MRLTTIYNFYLYFMEIGVSGESAGVSFDFLGLFSLSIFSVKITLQFTLYTVNYTRVHGEK